MTNFGKRIAGGVVILAIIVGFLIFLSPSHQSAPLPDSVPLIPLDTSTAVPKITEKCGFKLISPKPNDKVFITDAGLQIAAEVSHPPGATCNWTVFEAVAGRAELKSDDGTILGSTSLMAEGDWMTSDPVTFSGTIALNPLLEPTWATLTITEDDPSGMGNTDSVRVPLGLSVTPGDLSD